MLAPGCATIRILDSFNTDRLGAALTVSRIFDDYTRLNLTLRDESVELRDIDTNAPTIVFQSEGETEIRSIASREASFCRRPRLSRPQRKA